MKTLFKTLTQCSDCAVNVLHRSNSGVITLTLTKKSGLIYIEVKSAVTNLDSNILIYFKITP